MLPEIWEERLNKELEERALRGNLRRLPSDHLGIDFWSNDYLGLAKVMDSTPEYTHGASGSRLISGNLKEATEAESFLARAFNYANGLIYSSGYAANVGLISSLGNRHTVFIYDEQIHASVLDGIQMTVSKAYKFKHNDSVDLERLLANHVGQEVVVMVESIYSMSGDICPLESIIQLCKQYNAMLIVDEAHAAGIFGKGLVAQHQWQQFVSAVVVTFGKAYGCNGAAVLSGPTLYQYQINFSRSFIYSTALPSASYKQIQHQVGKDLSHEQQQLMDVIHYWKERVQNFNSKDKIYISQNPGPIQFVYISGNEACELMANALNKAGILVKAIKSPTVPVGKEGIRISLHAFNSPKEIDFLLQQIETYA